MPELHFKGKEFVYNHHLAVPYRPLEPQAKKGVGKVDTTGNLIIQGDNLHALKALLPTHAGKVDCVFIDPPYNTGNESWCYNDNVSSPMIKEWLSGNPVNKEDMLRHDKWLCMMWPRMVLLRELMSEKGSIWVTLDDNEIHRARMLMDEVFGEDNFVDTCIWQKNYAPKSSARHFSSDHDYILVYAKHAATWNPNHLERTEDQDDDYKNPDGDRRGPWKANNMSARNYYSKGTYKIQCPGGRVIDGPPKGRYWAIEETKFWALHKDGRVWWGKDGNNVPSPKIYRSEVMQGRVPQTLWFWSEVGHTQESKKEVIQILGFEEDDDVTITPKPVRLLERVLQLATSPDSLILDSFAGSGTTAHAVLNLNKKDGGNRKFILVECEDYADTLTAERVRRVMNGYAFKGTQKEELLREPLTLTKLKKINDTLTQADFIEAAEAKRFDSFSREVKDGAFILSGKKEVKSQAEGLGGSFTYCTLGAPLDLDKLLTGKSLPSFESLGAWAFHAATGQPFDAAKMKEKDGYLGETETHHVWLVYQPDLAWLKTNAAAITLTRAQEIVAKGKTIQGKKGSHKRNLVFAPACFASRKLLAEQGLPLDFAPLPYALYRLDKKDA